MHKARPGLGEPLERPGTGLRALWLRCHGRADLRALQSREMALPGLCVLCRGLDCAKAGFGGLAELGKGPQCLFCPRNA